MTVLRAGGGTAANIKARVLAALKLVPAGRVVTHDTLAVAVKVAPPAVATVLKSMSDDERQACPWHRAVAKGGAIGWGSLREQQFALLIREGVPVSPAGIVQDLARIAITDATRAPQPEPPAAPDEHARQGRSRGMRRHPDP